MLKKEFDLYNGNSFLYPFQKYIHWKPGEYGNILADDYKFTQILYNQHGVEFKEDYMLVKDLDKDTKSSIYDFIDRAAAKSVAIAVDCENSDPFKFLSTLKGLPSADLEKIAKITLYDDPNTTSGWDHLKKFTDIRIEHIEISRVVDRKSLVDIRMTASIVADFYSENISSFLIFSSDSDFFGLIQSLPQANFLVMYEREKCGTAIKQALEINGIYYCAIDDFCTYETSDLKRVVLLSELKEQYPYIYGMSANGIARMLYEKTKVSYKEAELERFASKYISTMKMTFKNGTLEYEITR